MKSGWALGLVVLCACSGGSGTTLGNPPTAAAEKVSDASAASDASVTGSDAQSLDATSIYDGGVDVAESDATPDAGPVSGTCQGSCTGTCWASGWSNAVTNAACAGLCTGSCTGNFYLTDAAPDEDAPAVLGPCSSADHGACGSEWYVVCRGFDVGSHPQVEWGACSEVNADAGADPGYVEPLTGWCCPNR